jgi:hypothetical protein
MLSPVREDSKRHDEPRRPTILRGANLIRFIADSSPCALISLEKDNSKHGLRERT